jgi:hypothetical protein
MNTQKTHTLVILFIKIVQNISNGRTATAEDIFVTAD